MPQLGIGLGTQFLKRVLLSIVKAGRVLDLGSLFGSSDSTITDRSGEGNDATLYTGRYIATDAVDDKGINADCTAAGSGNYYVTGKIRPSATTTSGLTIDGTTALSLTSLTADVWQDFTTSTQNSVTPDNIVVGWDGTSFYAADWSDVRLVDADTSTVVGHWTLAEHSAPAGDALNEFPALDSSGNGYHGTHIGCSGGTGETTILQTAGMDWNAYRTVKYSNVNGTPLRSTTAVVADPAGGSSNVTRITVSSSGSVAVSGISSLDVSHEAMASIEVYIPSSNTEVSGIWLSDAFGTSGFAIDGEGLAQDQWVTISGIGVPTTTDLRIQLDNDINGLVGTVGAGGIGDVVYVRNLQVTNGAKNVLVPVSDTNPSLDALGTAIQNPRPNNKVFNGFGEGEKWTVADATSIDAVKTFSGFVYWDGVSDTVWLDLTGADAVTISASAGALTSAGITTPTYYVNGAAGTSLNVGWNGIMITTATAVNCGPWEGEDRHGSIKGYSDEKAADDAAQNYNAQKGQYGL